MYLLGLDIGSSSIKAAIVLAQDGKLVQQIQYPEVEMDIISMKPGWAEQEPEMWWQNICVAVKKVVREAGIDGKEIKSIGIAYQMHGLVLIDKDHMVLRPSIIWCDSRAVEIGNKAFHEVGEQYCLDNYLNSPGNFTASKLKWVKENEPHLYAKIHKVMLPGDYVNMRLTGEVNTTITGLSEGVLWNFKENRIANKLIEYYGFRPDMIPPLVASIYDQGTIMKGVAEELGLNPKVKVTYRAGDQANNAMSLGVLEPNQVAATGGTSGVVYGIVDEYLMDMKSRVNGFAHVNHSEDQRRLGILLCINGAGIQYSWMKNQIARDNLSYYDMEKQINAIPVGSDGLRILPFGNGAERMLNNVNSGASINNLQFNRHTRVHLYRAALEGIAFSFVYGFQLLKNLGLTPKKIKVGNDNLFRSNVFSTTIANLLDTSIELVDTSGAEGAARASGIVVGEYSNLEEAVSRLSVEKTFQPLAAADEYRKAYHRWKQDVDKIKMI